MAEFVHPIGKIRGKYGNLIGYMGANGKNYCKGSAITRKSGGEPQKRQSVAFGTTVQGKKWMAKAVRLGFPGGNGYPKGFNGFISANVMNAITVEKIDPEKPLSPRKKATREFQGTIDYEKLRVAAGQLVIPVVGVEVDTNNRKVSFTSRGIPVEAVDCFLDDKIYGVILDENKQRCRVGELGTRGESINTSMDFPDEVEEADGIIVYVFAASADGKDVSDSVCLWKPTK